MDMETSNALAAFGLTDEELAAPLPVRVERDGRICACGHPMTKHTETDLSAIGRGIRVSCVPIRGDCGCQDPKPVAKAQDTRHFTWRTRGHGATHSLIIGAKATAKKGKTFDWLKGWPKCELAGWEAAGVECTASEGVLPYGFNRLGRPMSEDPEVTFLICRAHSEVALANGIVEAVGS